MKKAVQKGVTRLLPTDVEFWKLVLLFTFFNFSIALTQPLTTATRLTPWPPEAWPIGAQAEVRLIVMGTDDEVGVSFPVGDNGEITYDLPEQLPRKADTFFEPLDMDTLAPCDEIAVTLSPPDVEVVMLEFRLYADGEVWGTIDMSRLEQSVTEVTGENFLALVYARDPVRVGGGGVCPDTAVDNVFDLSLEKGRNLMVFYFEGTLDGVQKMTLTTSETLELPGMPVGY